MKNCQKKLLKKSNVVIFFPFFPAPAVKTNPSAHEKTIGKKNTKVVWSNGKNFPIPYLP